jgi:hypothetical protein
MGGYIKQFFEVFFQEITLNAYKNNKFYYSLIRAIDWYANYDIIKIKFFFQILTLRGDPDKKYHKNFCS